MKLYNHVRTVIHVNITNTLSPPVRTIPASIYVGNDKLEHLLAHIGNSLNIEITDIKSKKRNYPLPDVRKIYTLSACNLFKEKILADIGKVINCPHSTIWVQKREAKKLLQTDKKFKLLWEICFGAK